MATFRAIDVLGLLFASWAISQIFQALRRRLKSTELNGPKPKSWVFGASMDVISGKADELFEEWSKTHGSVFQVREM